MATTVREVLTKIGFQVENDKLKNIENQLEAIKQRVGFLAGVELARGLFELGEKFAHFAEQLHLSAESAGLTVEQLQKLTFAAKLAGVSAEETENAMARLSRALYNAKLGGSEAQKAFYLAGITQGQLQGFKTSQDALLALADRFKQIKDPIQKAALAQELMGRGSRQMVGFLSQGSVALRQQGVEAQRLGLIIDSKQVAALVKLEQALQKLYALISAIGARIAAYFAPILEFVINDFLKLVSANKALIELNIENFLYNVAFGLGFIYALLKDLIPFFFGWIKQFHGEGNILTFLGRIAGSVTGLLAVAAAFRAISVAVGLLTSPLLLIVASITAIVASVHDLYAMFQGKSGNDLWFNKIGGALTGIENPFDKLTSYLADKGDQGLKYAVNAGYPTTTNVTVNATTGASAKEIGREVADAIAEHHAQKMREARAGGATGVIR